MGFADKYIDKNTIFPALIKKAAVKNLNLIVVIPCFNEPDIISTIENLQNCLPTIKPVEIIVHINSGEGAELNIIEQNNKTHNELNKLFQKISNDSMQFHVIHNINLSKKHAGAGLARKIGMDEAIHRFNAGDNPDGIIISFDADTRCDANFLSEIEKHYINNPKTTGSNVYFEHPVDGNEFSTDIYKAIITYELYLRYYRQSLMFTGYPYSFHTIGSIFNVRASVYTAQGGMNRKQAGEDFYFLQKILPLGNFHEINTTCVYPSPRQSDRVPFGTGPMIKQIINDNGKLLTYSLIGFIDLKQHFDKTDDFYSASNDNILEHLNSTKSILKQFLIEIKFESAIKEIQANSSTLINFRKRYYKWFNALMILKYLNHSHKENYQHIDINIAVTEYFEIVKETNTKGYSTLELLNLLRSIEKNKNTLQKIKV